jgi:hypothetical protein
VQDRVGDFFSGGGAHLSEHPHRNITVQNNSLALFDELV